MILTGIIPIPVFAYDRATHEGITQAIVQGYEKLHGDTLDSSEGQRIIAGSSSEDDDWRFLNHFYDPINYRGLTVLGISLGQPSEGWAYDTRGQSSWRCVAYFPCSHDIKYNDKLFSSPADYSWDRAIYEYVYGDKQRGLEAVGHALHFVEDATVPAHVRNDQHGHIGSVGDADPYETFTSQFTAANISVPNNLSNVPTYSSLSSYLDHVARFTNTHFVSKDTMFSDFNSPTISGLRQSDDGFLYDKTLGLRVVAFESKTDTHNRTTYTYSLKDTKQLALTDNWNVLSKTAIVNGIGIIDLFFKSVEQEKKTGAIKAKNISAAEQNTIDLAKKGFKYVKALYGSSLSQSDVEELLGDNAGQAGAAALAVGNEPSPPQQGAPSASPAAPTVSQTNPPQPQAAPQVLGASVSPVEEPSEQKPPKQDATPPAPDPFELQTSAPAPWTNNSGGVSGGSPTPTTGTPTDGGSTPPAASDPLSISILSPDENELFGTTSVAFSGTTSASSVVTAAYDSTLATTTTDDNGNWSFILVLTSGTTTVSFSAATSTETTATSTRTVAVDVSSPDAPSISIDECEASFVAGDCTVAATTVTVSWNAVSGATYYDVLKNSVILATTTEILATGDIPASATTTFSVVAHKSNGTAATSTEKTVYVTTQPLIINEVAWAGTNTFPEDEWIEVKNITSSTLDLSHFVITTPDGSRTIQLSGTIAPLTPSTWLGFRVIERSAGAVSGVPDVLTSDFTQLSDSGEQLLLQWGNGVATTTVDSTPPVATCGGWCAGASEGSIGYSVQHGTTTMNLTMERKDSPADGLLASSWRTTDAYSFYGNDRSPSAIFGTPGVANSKGYPTVGWFCSPDTASIESGAHYTPPSSSCTYLLRAIGTNGYRYTALYRGEVASSTRVTLDEAGKAYIRQGRSTIIPDPQVGEHFFIAVFEGRIGPNFDPPFDDFTPFDTYFKTGAGAPPHSNYFVIPWVYGP
ncbi:MAG: hypothetical protein Q7R90_03580 [bacterium]|nr:hypothetical protein [bacterium]